VSYYLDVGVFVVWVLFVGLDGLLLLFIGIDNLFGVVLFEGYVLLCECVLVFG